MPVPQGRQRYLRPHSANRRSVPPATAARTEPPALAYDRFREVCHAHADRLVKAWRDPFDAGAATLVTAHERIGSVPLEDTATIMRRGDDIAAVWTTALAASATIDDIAAGWMALHHFTRQVANDRRHRVLRTIDVDYQTWTEQSLADRTLSPWDAVLAGLALQLPTVAEYRERVRTIEDGARRTAEREAQAAHDRLTGRRVAHV